MIRRLFWFCLSVLALNAATAIAQTAVPVTIGGDDSAYVLDNGIIAARIDKSSGDLVSLKYHGEEMLATILGPDGLPDVKADPPGANSRGFGPFTDHQYGFWSHDAMGPRGSLPLPVASVTIDPASNGGERAEVAVKGTGGKKMGTGPGSNANGNFISDIELRWCLGRGDSGVYTYCIFDHPSQYPASTITEARFCFKLNDFFDWMLVDQRHDKLYPKQARENKYDYTTDQFDHTAYGWASTTKQIGCFLINPSVEYLSGGPTKVEFLCHRDTNQVAAPTILNYWRSSHYGGASVSVAAGEQWTKVVGPFLLYVNSGSDPQTLWKDAQNQQVKESAQWPYDWVNGIDYPHHDQRATVSGKIALTDPLAPPGSSMSNLLVGLSSPVYTGPPGPFGAGRPVDWQTDAKHYEFWVRGSNDGYFTIPNVRPGTYTLHAIADGVLGEFAKTDVTVETGKWLDLGSLTWTPVRHGRQLWDIGIPNRNASEFFKGDDFAHDGMALMYATLFPNDVNFVIGKSDYHKDWYFQQPPHADAATIAAAAKSAARGSVMLPGTTRPAGARGFVRPPALTGAATPWNITFDMPSAPAHGKATLRLAISGTGARSVDVSLNGKSVGKLDRLVTDGTMGATGNGIQGIWYEREVPFDATLLQAGTNVLTLTVPAGPLSGGMIYDYLRLELDDSAQ
jgi:rhamnogalacturonan endolyase